MYKHNKEVLFIEREEMIKHSFFDPFFQDNPLSLPEDVVRIEKVKPQTIPTKYMIQLGGVTASMSKVIYMVEFKCKKARDSRF